MATTEKKADKSVTVEGPTYKATIKTGAKDQKPVSAEQAYFNKVSAGHNPNVLENPFSSVMTIADAKKVVEEKYKGFTGTEVPGDLQRAREILKKVNPS